MAMTWMDNAKRQWSCRLTIADAKRLKEAGIDIGDPESFKVLFQNALSQIELLGELHRPQWTDQQLTYEQFAELLIETEGRLAEVQSAFVEALTDFFRRLGEPWMAAVVEKARDAASKQAIAMMDRARSPKVDRLIATAMAKDEAEWEREIERVAAKISGLGSTPVQESWECIPGPGHSENSREPHEPG